MIAGLTASSAGLLFQITVRTSPAQPNDAALIAKAKRIHDRVLKLDTHNDIEPANFTADCNYKMRLTTQVNLPKMVEGDMDVSFMIAYVGQGPLTPEGFDGAYRQAVAKFDAVHRLTEKIAPDNIGLALTPADVLALHKKNLRIAVIGVENGYPIGNDHQESEGVLRPGRAIHVAGPQWQQPARRFEYRRNPGLPLQQWTVAARPGSHRRDESPGHDGRSVASLEGRKHGSHAAFAGSGNCVAFRSARARQRQPEYGRRAVAGSEEERRRDSGRGVRVLCQDGFERTHRCPREVA